MKIRLSLFFLALVVLSCNKEENNLWNISGKVVMTDSNVPEIQTPLENIKVYLMEAPVMMDTVKHWYAKEIIADSALSDGEGKYMFNSLLPDDYAVLAVDTSEGYLFDWSASPDSAWIKSDNPRSAFTINFTTPEPVQENLPWDDQFIFIIDNENWDSFACTIRLFRTARYSKGCGWFGLSPCGWYWEEVENSTILSGSEVQMFDEKDASNAIWDFKDEFHLKFYHNFDLKYTLNISGDDLTELNCYDVVWSDDNVLVTRTN